MTLKRFLVLFALLVLAAGCHNAQTSERKPTHDASSLSEQTSNWNKYQSDKYDFEFMYPNGFLLAGNTSLTSVDGFLTLVFYEKAPKDKFTSLITLTMVTNNSNESAAEYFARDPSHEGAQYSMTNVSGHDGILFMNSTSIGVIKGFLFIQGGHIFRLIVRNDSLAIADEYLRSMVDSFTTLK